MREIAQQITTEMKESVPSVERMGILLLNVLTILRTRMYHSGLRTKGAVVRRMPQALKYWWQVLKWRNS